MSTEYIFSIIINSKFDIFVCIYCKHYKIKAFEKRLYKVKILYGTSSYLNLYIAIYMYTHFKYIYRDYLRQWVHYFDRHWNCGLVHAQTGEQQSLSALFSAAYCSILLTIYSYIWLKWICQRKDRQSVIRVSIPFNIYNIYIWYISFSCYLPHLRNLMKFANRGL